MDALLRNAIDVSLDKLLKGNNNVPLSEDIIKEMNKKY